MDAAKARRTAPRRKAPRRRRVIPAGEAGRQGVMRLTAAASRIRLTRWQARVLAGALSLALLAVFVRAALRSPWLTVNHVSVTGVSRVSEREVREAAGIDGASIFSLDLDAARARVAALPDVRSVTVTRPGRTSVRLEVEERAPWGLWRVNDRTLPIDADGYVLDAAPPAVAAPLITELEPQRSIAAGDRIDPDAVRLAARLIDGSERELGRKTAAFLYREGGGLTAIFAAAGNAPPVWATFGSGQDLDYKIGVLFGVLQRASTENLTVHTVDLRYGDRVTFN